MGGEKLEPKKNPWANAARSEAELGPEEVARIRSDVRKRTAEHPDRIPLQTKENLQNQLIGDFRETLVEAGGLFTKVYKVDSAGHIIFEEDHATIDPAFYLSVLASRDDVKEVKDDIYYAITPDGIRDAARHITETYPDILFEFDESDKRDVFVCSARILSETPGVSEE